MLFQLTHRPIETLIGSLHPHSGGIVTFEGRVRAVNNDKEVSSLEYVAYPALALHEGHAIISEALERLDIIEACAVHRTGHLAIGDIAVWVMSAAVHRQEAFEATEYIINAIKTRVPIWKKEYYRDGEAIWVRCDHCVHDHSHTVKASFSL
jgi:molybdopterin synthase catalytic subunit